MRKNALILCFGLSIPFLQLRARTYVSMGYGLQLNALANKILGTNVNRLANNSSGVGLVGIGGLAPYSSNWSMSSQATEYSFVSLPELRVNSEWEIKSLGYGGFFATVSGLLPQTVAYYQGSATLTETNSCASVDFARCPLAALNFAPGGSGAYSGELRSNLRFFNFSTGFSFSRTLRPLGASGALVLAGELGLALQSFAVTSQWAFARCTSGTAIPCESTSQLRVVQGELRQQSVYALGPVVNVSMRYERISSFWFAELSLGATFLFAKLESAGYVNFVAAGTVAFSQTSAAQGVSDRESLLLVLPAAMLRFGVHL